MVNAGVTQAEMDAISDRIETLMAANGISVEDQSIIVHGIQAHVLSAFAQGIAQDVQDIKDEYGMDRIKETPETVVALVSGLKVAEQALAEAHQSAAVAYELLVLGNWESLED